MKNKTKILCIFFAFFIFSKASIFSQDYIAPKIKTVVIDPGHGGKDPGAVGKYSKEKDIVLALALKTKELINQKYPDVKVILTRGDDTFVELFKRAEIANKNNADLFISIHINASSNSAAKGTETFVMGLHKNSSNLEVAKLENSVILKEDNYEDKYGGFDPNDPESHIVFSLFQNAHQNQSLFMSQLVQDMFSSNLSLNNRGVKQAGFLVLWKTTMPSILVEAGFISNPAEEKYLNSKEGQENIAKSIFQAFSKYKKYYEDEDIDITSEEIAETIVENIEEDKNEHNDNIEDIVGDALKDNLKADKDIVQIDENGIVFKVQIATSSSQINISPDNFKGHSNVEFYYLDNIYRYTIGKSTDFDEINELRKNLAEDFEGCFVVAFNNGERISVQEARRLLK